MLRPLVIGGQNCLAEEGRRCLAKFKRDGDGLHSGVWFSVGRGCVLVEDDVPALVMIQAGQTLHEVADLVPFVIIAFEQISTMLDGDDDSTAVTDFRLRG